MMAVKRSFVSNYVRILISGDDVRANKRLFKQILQGVQYIHSQNLLHRDLKVRQFLSSCIESDTTQNDKNKLLHMHGLENMLNSILNSSNMLYCIISLSVYQPNIKILLFDDGMSESWVLGRETLILEVIGSPQLYSITLSGMEIGRKLHRLVALAVTKRLVQSTGSALKMNTCVSHRTCF